MITTKLKCPKCEAVHESNDMNLDMQFMMLKSGGSIGGGLTIHCPSCSYSAHVSQWYNSSKHLNP